jgi:hypothetical protein
MKFLRVKNVDVFPCVLIGNQAEKTTEKLSEGKMAASE